MRQRVEPAVEVPEQTAVEEGPDELAELSWLAWRVHAAVERLPERERSVLELAYWSASRRPRSRATSTCRSAQ